MITVQHNLSDEELAAMMPRLSDAFARAGMAFAEMSAQFERVGDAGSDFSTAAEVLKVTVMKLHNDEATKAQLDAGLFLQKQTAWERRNVNAPWWRRFQNNHARRRS